MVSWGWLIVTFVLGGWFGFLIAALCHAATYNNNKENEE